MGSLPEFSSPESEPPRILLHSHLCISTYSKIVRWYKKYFPTDGLAPDVYFKEEYEKDTRERDSSRQ